MHLTGIGSNIGPQFSGDCGDCVPVCLSHSVGLSESVAGVHSRTTFARSQLTCGDGERVCGPR